ncbi:STAS domain-containing protein [[Limnothrix rosea] IAM M-220]|uniref:STAS domain-containing protein n=1 Tax=[Limnothrix rosea] IAM M-220 TaxID=454133 RepID=UPI00095F37F2|nr:STAS domain-containing protein [[Limnothrix rosea] IAM M-220]OKH18783.1 anti-anti-sigma factor [[Limnothrix rosea] IAM M-220]
MDQLKTFHPTGIFDNIKVLEFRDDVLKSLTDEGKKHILLNFSGITFMDSAGLGSLVLLLKTVRAHGGTLYLCHVNQQIKMLFELTNMDRIFKIFTTEQAFLEQYQD